MMLGFDTAILATLGLNFIAAQYSSILTTVLFIAIANIIWYGVWYFLGQLHPETLIKLGPAIDNAEFINFGLATTSWLVALTAMFILLKISPKLRTHTKGLRILLVVTNLAWSASLLLPQIGQSGSWSSASIRLGLLVVGLSLAMALAATIWHPSRTGEVKDVPA